MQKMEYNFLGKSGLKVSNICLGTMTFGASKSSFQTSTPTQLDINKSHEILNKYVEFGGNFIDTADAYGSGLTEKIIGDWLQKQKRDNLVVATKVRFQMGPDPNNIGLSRRHIIQSCEESLDRLRTNYIDLYQTHGWDAAVPLGETYRALDDLVRCGKVRYIGLSNVCGWQLQKIVDMTKSIGLSSVISLQQQYNLLCRHPEFEEFQVCVNEGIGVLPWSPLKGGLLAGKFQRGVVPSADGSRIGSMAKDESKALQSAPAWSKYNDSENYWTLIERMKEFGASLGGKTIPQVAIRWLLQKNIVPSVIIGATSVNQLEDNIGAANGWKLSKEQMEELDRLTMTDIPYPYEMIWRINKDRQNAFCSSSFVQNAFANPVYRRAAVFVYLAGKQKMEYNYLGKSGLKVSNICLGTMTFGVLKEGFQSLMTTNLDKDGSHEVLNKYVEYGGNFLDTANVYGRGLSESIIGEWLERQKRDDIVVATKVRAQMGNEPNNIGISRRHIIQSCEESLDRLKTNYIDLYQTHGWDNAVPIEESYRTLDDLVRCGKVRYVGLSNVCGWQLQKIVDMSKTMGLSSIVSLQQQYSLLCRHPEFEELQVCVNEGIGVIPWSPLKGGLLTGKFKRGETPSAEKSRIGAIAKDEKKAMQAAPAWSQYNSNDQYWALIEKMREIGKSLGKTVAQVAIRWLLQKNIVPSVIIGATSIKQLGDNIGAGSGWKLSKEQMEELDQLSTTDIPYPYEMLYRLNGNRVNPYNRSSLVQNVY